MSGIGSGLGTVIGSSLASGNLTSGLSNINSIGSNFENTVGPDVSFGQSMITPATTAINNINRTAGTEGFEDFLKNYQTSPGAQYQIGVADAAQNNSAAANGQLLSGSNLRSLSTINQGIASTDANNSYNEYLAGNNQNFSQLEQSLGNMFQAIGVGTTATGQEAGLDTAQMGTTSQIAQAEAKNSQSKGSGIGSLFSGIGNMIPGMSTTF